ncbi:hypothetical protein [Pirellula sp. SH-Sr6A]|uniref:hypothetical protein n=1 Tax=Pirellula sp. SH-Sr6A TaxID=1632865 RepID=UPI0011BA989F|nr:hypothetical protein [Pirellula sp. SH-Sr6A]
MNKMFGMIRYSQSLLILVLFPAFAVATTLAQEGKYSTSYLVVIDTSPSMFEKPVSPLAINWKEPAMVEVQRQLGEFVTKLPEGTEMDLASFDTAYRNGPSLHVRTQAERDTAKQYFQSLRPVGGMTHLWASMELALEQASDWLSSHPGGTIRILFYTDGTDTEHLSKDGIKRDPQAILAKYSNLLKNQVRFNLVTIGFELKSEVLEKLEAGNVTVTKAISTQQNLIPLESAFRLAPATPLAGEVVRLHDESQGLDIVKRETDWGDGTINTDQSHVYAAEGEFVVRHTVTTQNKQVAVSTQRLVIAKPAVIELPKLQASFELLNETVFLGEYLQVIDESVFSGTVTRSLTLNGAVVSNERNPRVTPNSIGSHTLELELRDEHGQVSRSSRKFAVKLPIAPQAKFRLSNSQITAGETVQAIDESMRAESWSWSTSAGHTSNERNPAFLFNNPGSFDCFLEVADRFGQKSKVAAKLTVAKPAAPQVDFFAPESVIADSEIQIINRAIGLIDSQKWIVDGLVASTDRDLQLKGLSVGEHAVELVAEGPGGVSRVAKKLVVLPYALPKASFTIGTAQPFVGDTVTFTDTSTGKIDRVEWWFNGSQSEQSCDYTKSGSSRTINFTCKAAGKLVIRAMAYGPSGSSECEQEINIASRTQPPKTIVSADSASGRGELTVRFTNHSEGTIYRTIVDFGDGSPSLELNGCDGAAHTYRPGKFTAKFTSVGPEEFGVSTSTLDIEVAKPIPMWVWHSIWATPLGIGLLAGVVLAFRKRQDSMLMDEAAKLSGIFSYKPKSEIGTQFESVPLDGSKDQAEISLSDGSKAVLRSMVDDEGIRFVLTIDEKGNEFTGILKAGVDETVGSYVVNYVQ